MKTRIQRLLFSIGIVTVQVTTGICLLMISASFAQRVAVSQASGQTDGTNVGTSRSNPCLNPLINTPLIALVPTEKHVNNGRNYVFGETRSQEISIFVYVPYVSTNSISSTRVEFLLEDQNANVKRKHTFLLSSKPGIVRINVNLPNKSKNYYLWYFTIKCDGEEYDQVSAWVRLQTDTLDKVWYDELRYLANQGTVNWKERLAVLKLEYPVSDTPVDISSINNLNVVDTVNVPDN